METNDMDDTDNDFSIDLSNKARTRPLTAPPLPVMSREVEVETDLPFQHERPIEKPYRDQVERKRRPKISDSIETHYKPKSKAKSYSSQPETQVKADWTGGGSISPDDYLAESETEGISDRLGEKWEQLRDLADVQEVFMSFATAALISSLTFYVWANWFLIYLFQMQLAVGFFLAGVLFEQVSNRQWKRFVLTVVAVLGLILGAVLILTRG